MSDPFTAWWPRRSVWPTLPVPELVELLGGRTVSVVVPALNEARTVAGVVGPLMTELVPAGLVHEVLVVDGRSLDDTAAVAEKVGARVVTVPEKEGGFALAGKGGALWWAQQQAVGDLLVFLDADVVPSRAATATALLTPLLLDPAVRFVKAAFDRPLTVDGVLHHGSGGRVTEMLARPLLNAWWPELAGFVQPLSGELAATRELLGQVQFGTGYALEIAMLVDVLALAGLDAMAQADIGERQHRHQSDAALSRMAAEVLAAALDRHPGGPHGDTFTAFVRSGTGFDIVRSALGATFLPPVAPR